VEEGRRRRRVERKTERREGSMMDGGDSKVEGVRTLISGYG